jgi:hypothetical protein
VSHREEDGGWGKEGSRDLCRLDGMEKNSELGGVKEKDNGVIIERNVDSPMEGGAPEGVRRKEVCRKEVYRKEV